MQAPFEIVHAPTSTSEIPTGLDTLYYGGYPTLPYPTLPTPFHSPGIQLKKFRFDFFFVGAGSVFTYALTRRTHPLVTYSLTHLKQRRNFQDFFIIKGVRKCVPVSGGGGSGRGSLSAD